MQIVKLQQKPPVEFLSRRKGGRAFFFPTLGYYSYSRRAWSLPIHAWLYRNNSSKASRLALKLFKKALIRSEIFPEQIERLNRRTSLFVANGVPRQRILLKFGEKLFVIGKSRMNGHLKRTVNLTGDELRQNMGIEPRDDSWITYSASMANGQVFDGGEIQLLNPVGISIISDIDDTLKYSGVEDTRELLLNTFLNRYKPLSGMVPLYQKLSAQGAAFHYVSSTPWQLFEHLQEFVEEWQLPKGSFHLKSIYWKDLSWLKLLASPEGTKPKVIDPILRSYPYRKFVLIGDAVERDPEIYLSLIKRYPDRISRVLIRDEKGLNGAQKRMEESGLQKRYWQVFSCGEEIESDLQKLTSL